MILDKQDIKGPSNIGIPEDKLVAILERASKRNDNNRRGGRGGYRGNRNRSGGSRNRNNSNRDGGGYRGNRSSSNRNRNRD